MSCGILLLVAQLADHDQDYDIERSCHWPAMLLASYGIVSAMTCGRASLMALPSHKASQMARGATTYSHSPFERANAMSVLGHNHEMIGAFAHRSD
jgi:hypothetical protein